MSAPVRLLSATLPELTALPAIVGEGYVPLRSPVAAPLGVPPAESAAQAQIPAPFDFATWPDVQLWGRRKELASVSVPELVIGPPLSPVPAPTSVTVPLPAGAPQATCPSAAIDCTAWPPEHAPLT